MYVYINLLVTLICICIGIGKETPLFVVPDLYMRRRLPVAAYIYTIDKQHDE
jgi:hypothetical protein